jgi:hypothetical protein
MNRKSILLIITLLLLASAGGFSNTDAAGASCDRECLKGFITQYLNAMVAHKPESLSVTSELRFTEDCKEINLGDGFWKTVTGLTNYRMDFIDVNLGGAISYVVAKEGSALILLVVRLKVVDNKISQIETMVVKNASEGMIFNTSALKTPSEAMTKTPDKALLNTRTEMVNIAKRYPEGLKIGSFVKIDLQVTTTAYRFENGQTMASGNIKTQALPTLSGMVYQVAAVDEELGVVVLRMNFGAGSVMNDNNNYLDVFESFKIYSGQIQAVEAFMQKIPKGTTFGWVYVASETARPLSTGATRSTGKLVATARGIVIPSGSFSDRIVLEMYDISGRLVCTKDIAHVQQQKSILIPLNLHSAHWNTRIL